MSGATDTSSPASLKRSTSPRPPVVGEEVKRFHDTSHPCPEQYKNWNMDCNSKAACNEPADQSVSPCTDNVTETKDCAEKSPNPSPPAALKWAQSLQCLLEDIQGVSLFKEFLEQDGQESYLSCWFACRGVKKIDPSDRERLINSIKIVFLKKVKKISAISDETKEEIKQKLAKNTGLDNTILDKAQQEVEAYMMKTTYPNFLKSDLYIQHLGGWQNELSPERERIVTPEPVEQLPTVHEDSELYIPSKIPPLTKTNLLQRNKSSYNTSKCKPEALSGLLKSPYNYGSYHAKYSAYLPVSAQDSEIQSLSSDAQTDDTMSLTDGSNVDYPTHSRIRHKRPQKVYKHQNNPIYNPKDKLAPQLPTNFIPRTERLPDTKQLSQEEFHAALVKALNKVVEERKKMEKVNEKLKMLEDPETSRPNEVPYFPAAPDASVRQHHKANQNPALAPVFIAEFPDENNEDILDQHISRVFSSGQQTPAGVLSPTVPRPSSELEKSRVPMQGCSGSELEYPPRHAAKYRKDHDTYSTDSAVYPSDDNLPIDYSRRYKDHSKRSLSRKISSVAADSGSSCFDSGISGISETVPSYSKVTHWLETKRLADQEREQHSWRNSSTSPVLSRSSSSRKTGHNSCRGGSQDAAYSQWSGAPAQQYPHDLVQGFSAADTTLNLVEARRRLEDESRAKQKINRKPNRKSPSLNMIEVASANNPSSNDVTVIGYSYGRHSVPYLSKMPGRNITLRMFKSMLSKKGNFRYFFKTASDDLGTGVVFEEVTEDSRVLPLWEGKVFCVIESMDDNIVM